jgi:hypothetical protein
VAEPKFAPALRQLDALVERQRKHLERIEMATVQGVQLKVRRKTRPVRQDEAGVMTRWGVDIEALLTTYVDKGGDPDNWTLKAQYTADDMVLLTLKGAAR